MPLALFPAKIPGIIMPKSSQLPNIMDCNVDKMIDKTIIIIMEGLFGFHLYRMLEFKCSKRYSSQKNISKRLLFTEYYNKSCTAKRENKNHEGILLGNKFFYILEFKEFVVVKQES